LLFVNTIKSCHKRVAAATATAAAASAAATSAAQQVQQVRFIDRALNLKVVQGSRAGH